MQRMTQLLWESGSSLIRLLPDACPIRRQLRFRLTFNYFVDTIKYAHMGRNQAQAEHQKSWA